MALMELETHGVWNTWSSKHMELGEHGLWKTRMRKNMPFGKRWFANLEFDRHWFWNTLILRHFEFEPHWGWEHWVRTTLNLKPIEFETHWFRSTLVSKHIDFETHCFWNTSSFYFRWRLWVFGNVSILNFFYEPEPSSHRRHILHGPDFKRLAALGLRVTVLSCAFRPSHGGWNAQGQAPQSCSWRDRRGIGG